MSGIFFREICVENYKCFRRQPIQLSVPDGTTEGSGLTVLAGENGTGKTAFLEAIDFITQSTFATENRLQVRDFTDYRDPIKVTAQTTSFKCKLSFPRKGYFVCHGLEFVAKNRDRKSRGKLLSPPFNISTTLLSEDTYRNENGDDTGNKIPPLELQFRNSAIQDSELNVFYFDKNRVRQISPGTFKTTFERISDDLNWKFLRGLDETKVERMVENVAGDYFSEVMAIAQKGTGSKLADEMATFFEQELYRNLRIDLLDLLQPFSSSFFALRKDGELPQILPRSMGSGVEIVLTLLLLQAVSSESKGGIVYLLDEPELHLHPKAQQKLMHLLKAEAATKQIVLSTHSPYILRECMSSDAIKLLLFRRSGDIVAIEDASRQEWGDFPWSPSWGEVNYVAYRLATVEYLNELYGWLQERCGLPSILAVEEYLVGKGAPTTKQWIEVRNGKPKDPRAVTICTYVRNSIHHPENRRNDPYTPAELQESIEVMIQALRQVQDR